MEKKMTVAHPLIEEISNIEAAYRSGQLSLEEKNYLLLEIRDIRAAQDCAGNEQMFRYIVQAVNIAAAVV
jgi:hypothetical protein